MQEIITLALRETLLVHHFNRQYQDASNDMPHCVLLRH